MLLEKLREYSERIDSTPVMYKETPIRWVINLDAQGNFKGIVETASEQSGKKKAKGKSFLAPTLRRTSGVRAIILSDKVEYVFGLDKDGKPGEWAAKCQKAFKDLIDRCAKDSGCASALAVKKFYDSYAVGELNLPEGFNYADLFTFSVNGSFPIDEPSVRAFWATEAIGNKKNIKGNASTETAESKGDDGKGNGSCMVCGEIKSVVASMPIPIKNIPGNKAEYSLVAHNIKASESFELKRSHNSPICRDCGEAFCKALNNLLDKPDTHIRVGDIVYVFWTKAKIDFDITTFFTDPKPEDIKKLLAKPLTGERAFEQDESLFYCAAFSSSVTRVVMRDWIVTTLGDAQRNLARYFRAQALVEWDGSEGAPLPLWKMTKSLVPQKKKGTDEAPPNVPKTILRFAFNGGELPLSLLFQAVKRECVEAGRDKKTNKKFWDYVYRNRSRMALIKMVLVSRKEYLNREESMEKIDLSNESPAYLCGRLFALIEAVQKAAMPGVNTTVTDRFYGTASTAPASVFGWLNKGCQNHLAKLRKEKPGAFFSLDEDLKEIASRLKTFPRTLNLEEQGLFALGFYHQKAHRSAMAAERKARRAEEQAAE